MTLQPKRALPILILTLSISVVAFLFAPRLLMLRRPAILPQKIASSVKEIEWTNREIVSDTRRAKLLLGNRSRELIPLESNYNDYSSKVSLFVDQLGRDIQTSSIDATSQSFDSEILDIRGAGQSLLLSLSNKSAIRKFEAINLDWLPGLFDSARKDWDQFFSAEDNRRKIVMQNLSRLLLPSWDSIRPSL